MKGIYRSPMVKVVPLITNGEPQWWKWGRSSRLPRFEYCLDALTPETGLLLRVIIMLSVNKMDYIMLCMREKPLGFGQWYAAG